MAQINFHTTPDFERDLAVLMDALRLKNKSLAIRFAVREMAAVYCLLRAREEPPRVRPPNGF